MYVPVVVEFSKPGNEGFVEILLITSVSALAMDMLLPILKRHINY